MAPTAAATMAPTAAPRATAAPTTVAPTAMMAMPEPVQPRLRVSLPPGNEQFTIPYPMSQVSEKLMPIYSHMIGRNIKTNVEEPQLATSWEVESPTARPGTSPSQRACLSIGTQGRLTTTPSARRMCS